MTFGETLASVADATESHMHTAATWLLGAYAASRTEITAAEAADPLVKAAAAIAVQEATAHGVPVAGIETLGPEVLALAQTIAAATTPSPATAEPPAA
jgi:hypothetical protein